MHVLSLLLAAALTFGSGDATVQLSVTASRGWPAPMTVRLLDLNSANAITRELTASDAAALRTLALPAGRYRLTFLSPGHASTFRDVAIRAGEAINLGEIALPELAVIRGRVLNGAHATITGGQATTQADASGAYELVPQPGEWPAFVAVAAPSRGTRIIEVPKSTASVELPPVTLAAPASLHVSFAKRPRGDLDVVLEVPLANNTNAAIRRLHLGSERASFDLRDLASGSYTLVVHGAGPLQQFATRVILGDGDERRETLAIAPLPFSARITMGAKPLANGTITMQHAELGWRGELRADAAGRIETEVWQTGAFHAGYRSDAAATAFMQDVTLKPVPPVSMSLDVAAREVHGRVVDGDGLPVPAARVFLRTTTGDDESTVRTQSENDGSFRFVAVAAGRQLITVIADGYLSPDPIDFALRDDEAMRDVPVRVDAGIARRLRIVDAEGHPAIAAEVVVTIDGDVRAVAVTDVEGRASVPTKSGAANVLYVLARDGAFTAVRPRDEDVVRVALPRPASSLHITTRTTDGKPLAAIALLMSFDGEAIPPEVARRFARTHGALATDGAGEVVLRNLPAGSYQFWPYGSDEEAESILAAGLLEAPINVNVKSGENAIVVDFEAR